jgi:3'-phosphoadenosine 5'-phosphosulfate sulfotransferase (PAPS reductase)/FAD synthetase
MSSLIDIDDSVTIPAMRKQLSLFEDENKNVRTFFSAPHVDVNGYDIIVLCMSGGKDSIACLLHLLDLGVDRSKLELWHHDVDGNEGSELMDWPFMRDYVRKLAGAFSLPLYFSWLVGGFEGEMLKNNSYSQPHQIETPDGLILLPRDEKRAKPGTRLRYPQQSPSLATRWCSSALKIDVGRRALNNQARFNGKKILFITGERRQESANRAKYNQLEAHACDRRDGRTARHVDAWRPVLEWDETQVWEILRRYQVLPPVPYRLHWSRSSCMNCIYNHPRVWATIGKYFPCKLKPIGGYETQFGLTISRSKIPVITIAATAEPFEITDLVALRQASEHVYTLPIFANSEHPWILPPGAFGREGCGSD